MNNNKDNIPNDKPIVIIDDKPEIMANQSEGETPVVTIESDEDISPDYNITIRPQRRLPWILGSAIITVILCILIALGYKYYRTYINIGIPVSLNSEQNIANLKKPIKKEIPEVVMTSDSILGVALNFYELRGLKGEISFEQPDTTATDVYLYSRCSDFTSYNPQTNHYIGSLVVNGKEIESDVSRLGYCAMVGNNTVVGVARDEKVKDYCIDHKGSFFRQFILVSNGVLPSTFQLHGKVERRAIGRIGDKIYYIESKHKEVMWAFADALREYGFTDAVYITGGTDYSFYRTADGKLHSIGNTTGNGNTKHKGAGIIPWLVFKKR